MPEGRSVAATFSSYLGGFAALLVAVGATGAWLEVLQPLQGFGFFGLGLILGAVTLAIAIVALFRTRGEARRASRRSAWAGASLGLVLTGILVVAPECRGQRLFVGEQGRSPPV